MSRIKGEEEKELNINDIFTLIKYEDSKQSVKLKMKESKNGKKLLLLFFFKEKIIFFLMLFFLVYKD